ncbi:uncharacterized protein LOC125514216 [Triticum urartu]|uniref:uncharacterized protein LOC125514216 n=1 Tax=Triticum urartu TaxID=4572 RepID=UPI002043E392|nr:uncharacterized protein LOC125514216 [Triticum urartu]
MFAIQEKFWVPMATLNFSGTAAVWLQSIQKKLSEFDWESFSSLLCTRFGRDRHQLLSRQFYTLAQTTTVADYIERFEQIISHLSAYSDSIHPYYYLTRFVEGLRADILAIVLVQRPPDLDTACALALLQEEVANGGTWERPRQPTTARAADLATRAHVGMPMPLPPPPPQGRPPTTPATSERRTNDTNRSDNSKIKALREYRRARGLSFKCGERWGQDHTCPTSVQLHVVEELLELLGMEGSEELPNAPTETVMAISRQALTGGTPPKAVKLQAWLQGRAILLLVDFGSSISFIDAQLAASLSGVVQLNRPCRVKVADGGGGGVGGELCCVSHIPKCCWSIQEQEFSTDMKILPLGVYDAILGMDWLEEHNPMNVDWRDKQLWITTPTGTMHLQGQIEGVTSCTEINSLQLQCMQRQGEVAHVVQLY